MPFFLHFLAVQFPMLAACLIGMVVAIVLFRRSAAASILCALGLCSYLVTTVCALGFEAVLINAQHDLALDDRALYHGVLQATQILASCSHAISIALLVVAAFVGRRLPEAAQDES